MLLLDGMPVSRYGIIKVLFTDSLPALLLTKWTHTLELEQAMTPPDEEEMSVLAGLRELLAEVEVDYDPNSSLAAAVAKFCSSTLTDVWVWGITPRMGNVLEHLAKAYEARHQNMMTMGLAAI